MEKNKKTSSLEFGLFEIPHSWIWERLDQLCSKITDGTHQSPSNDKTGDVPYITAKNIRPGKIDLSNLTYISKKIHSEIFSRCNPEKHDVLYTKDGTVGYAAVNELDYEFSMLSSVSLLKPLFEIIDPYFLMYYLNSPVNFNRTTGKMTGTALKRIILERVKEIPIPLAPSNEQKRIVAKIEELFSILDNSFENMKHIEEKLRRYRNSIFESLFNQGKELHQLSDLCEIGTGGTPRRNNSEYYGGDIPWIKTTEVKYNFITDTEEKLTNLGLENSNAKIFPKNSIIVAMYGEGKTRGRCAITGIPASTNQACAVIVCNPEKLDYRYCFYWLQSQYDKIRSKSSGGNQPNLNLTKVKKFQIPITSLSDQRNIVNTIEKVISEINSVSQQIDKNLQLIKNAYRKILELAFEGKLVPQDPNDEPAEILLQKIKQEKLKLN